MSETVFAEPTWAIVELFGRHVLSGQVSEVAIAGTDMLRVDVPSVNGNPAYTKFYGGQAIYAITPTDELSAMHAIEHLHSRPFETWVIPERQIPATVDDEKGFVENEELPF